MPLSVSPHKAPPFGGAGTAQAVTERVPGNWLALPETGSPSQALRASSPKGRALGMAGKFTVKVQRSRFRQSLSLWERWQSR